MKDYTNYPCYHIEHQRFNVPRGVKPKSSFENPFQSLLPAHLLVSILAVICQSYSITNGTVSNKIANIWSICGPVFKTFISIITKYELITIFEA